MPDNRIDTQDVMNAAFARWPDASEVHVQFHTHRVGSRLGSQEEGVCICAVEGFNVRRQFTAKTPQLLIAKVDANQADWKDASDFWENEDQDDHR